jgi:hypothetical protein
MAREVRGPLRVKQEITLPVKMWAELDKLAGQSLGLRGISRLIEEACNDYLAKKRGA